MVTTALPRLYGLEAWPERQRSHVAESVRKRRGRFAHL